MNAFFCIFLTGLEGYNGIGFDFAGKTALNYGRIITVGAEGSCRVIIGYQHTATGAAGKGENGFLFNLGPFILRCFIPAGFILFLSNELSRK